MHKAVHTIATLRSAPRQDAENTAQCHGPLTPCLPPTCYCLVDQPLWKVLQKQNHPGCRAWSSIFFFVLF